MPPVFPAPGANYTGTKSFADALRDNLAEPLVPVVNDVINAIPEMSFFQSTPVHKISYKTLHITGIPKTAFRKPGTLRTYSTAITELRSVDCAFLDASWMLETAIARAYDRGEGEALMLYQKTHLQSALFNAAKQIWYGVDNDADGFVGLNAILELAPEGKVIDLGGTANCTSVYAVRTGMDSCMLAHGNDGQIVQSDVYTQKYGGSVDGTTGEIKGAEFYSQEISAYLGLQVTSYHAISKIKNASLTEDGKGLDSSVLRRLIYNTFPAGIKPDALFMTTAAWTQYCETLVAYNPAGLPATMMDNIDGIPIIRTDAIRNDEETI